MATIILTSGLTQAMFYVRTRCSQHSLSVPGPYCQSLLTSVQPHIVCKVQHMYSLSRCIAMWHCIDACFSPRATVPESSDMSLDHRRLVTPYKHFVRTRKNVMENACSDPVHQDYSHPATSISKQQFEIAVHYKLRRLEAIGHETHVGAEFPLHSVANCHGNYKTNRCHHKAYTITHNKGELPDLGLSAM